MSRAIGKFFHPDHYNALHFSVSTRRNFAYILLLEPLWILALGIPILLPGRFLPLALHPYLLVILFLFWPLRWFEQLSARRASGRAHLLGSPITLPVFLLLLWLPVTIWVSADRAASWEAAGYLVWGIALYQALIRWAPACATRLWWWACCCSSLPVWPWWLHFL
ncbi:MAG: hypothetical protein DCC55_20670 [Chloroflexi bacterium]|nr:MAG: hypothetical protein DCC55_20670 [Chloroflexota bacterium]